MTPARVFPSLSSNRRRSRKNTADRGYGSAHRALRRRIAPLVARGTQPCARCGELILVGQWWDLDHKDDRRGYLGPSHRLAKDCPAGGNRSTSSFRPQSRRW